jgi:hypothetical protein
MNTKYEQIFLSINYISVLIHLIVGVSKTLYKMEIISLENRIKNGEYR